MVSKDEGEKWISRSIKRPGALHKELHISSDKKIPNKILEKAESAHGKIGKRARLAKTLSKFDK